MKTITRLTAMLLLLASIGFAAPKPSFELIEIEGAQVTQVRDINNLGDVSGTYYPDFGQIGFIRKANGDVIKIQVPDAPSTFVWGLDDHGNATGFYYKEHSGGSFVYRNGQITLLPSNLQAFDINGDSVVGSVVDTKVHGFVYTQDTLTLLDYPGSGETVAYGITPTGKIVGRYGDGTGQHGFVYDNGQWTSFDFPVVGIRSTEIYSAAGHFLLGAFWDGSCQFEPFVAIRGRFFQINLPGTSISGINNDGFVAGTLGNTGFIAKASAFILRK